MDPPEQRVRVHGGPGGGAGGARAATVARVLRERTGRGGLWVDVGGVSMEPTITGPARAFVGRTARPRWGEVWAFVDTGGNLTVHRCLRSGPGDTWVFRGDGADRTDDPVPMAHLVGRVERVEDQRGVRRTGRSRSTAVRSTARGLRGLLRSVWG